MKKRLKKFDVLLCVFTIAFCLLFTSFSFAGVKINGIGSEYAAITTAVNNAVGGDVLIVTTGTYAEAVNIYNLDINIDGGYNFDYSTKSGSGSTVINPPLWYGSCIDINNSTVRLIDLELTGSGFIMGGSGGGLDIRLNSDVIAENCDIHNNGAPDFGGGVYITQSTLVLSNSPVSDCRADYGGGIYADNSSVFLLGASIVRNNNATYLGGGMRLVNGSHCDVNNTSADIKGNFALSGGGIAVKTSSFVLRSGADIIGNTAVNSGGGIYLENNSTALCYGLDTSIGFNRPVAGLYPNSVTNGSGGGIYADNSTVILSNNARVASNYASDSGGGIFLTNSSAYIYGANVGYESDISTNYAHSGGGIYAVNSSLMITNHSKIMNGFASEAGGILASFSTVNIYDSIIGSTNIDYGNIASVAAGILFLNSTSLVSNSEIIGNQALYAGGLTFASTNSIFIKNSIISNNITYGFIGGAGVFGASAGSFIFDNSEIVNNMDLNFAGGIYWAAPATMIMRNGSRLCNNVASNAVGGAFANQGQLLFEDSEISGNHAGNDIGGIAAVNGAKLSLTDCIVNNNQADTLGETNGFCGGIYIKEGILDIVASNSNFMIISNSAVAGGAIYAESAIVSIKAFPGKICEIENNSATISGGGIYISDGTTSTISGNVSVGMNSAFMGGGIYITNNCQLSVYSVAGDKPIFKANTANYIGGAIYCYDHSSIFLTNMLMTGNTAGFGCGGMLISEKSEITAINSKIVNNYALLYGAIGCGDSKLTIDSDFSLPNSTDFPASIISENRSTNYSGIYAMDSDVYIANTMVVSNYSELGGAIVVISSTGQFVNLVVADNYGGGLGDGFAFANNEFIKIQQCTIANNYSNGVYQSTNGVPAYLQNCIAWGHLGEQVSSNATAVFCDVQNGFSGAFNITNDPLFEDTAALNYQVIASSPTVDSGMTLLNVTNDCIGNPRPYDGAWDMGAYEVVPEVGMLFGIQCSLLGVFCLLRRRLKN